MSSHVAPTIVIISTFRGRQSFIGVKELIMPAGCRRRVTDVRIVSYLGVKRSHLHESWRSFHKLELGEVSGQSVELVIPSDSMFHQNIPVKGQDWSLFLLLSSPVLYIHKDN